MLKSDGSELEAELRSRLDVLVKNSSDSTSEIINLRAEVRQNLHSVVAWLGGVQNLLANLSFVVYLVGVCLALGMNWSIKGQGIIASILLSLLSWINVGFNLMAKLDA